MYLRNIIFAASDVQEESETVIDEENIAPKDFLDEKAVIMLPGSFDHENRGVSIINNILTLTTNLPRVSPHAGFDGFFLENKNLDGQATVNGKVAMEILIKSGDKMEIKDCKFKYKQNNHY